MAHFVLIYIPTIYLESKQKEEDKNRPSAQRLQLCFWAQTATPGPLGENTDNMEPSFLNREYLPPWIKPELFLLLILPGTSCSDITPDFWLKKLRFKGIK